MERNDFGIIIDGKLEIGIPDSFDYSDGKSVSNYYNQDESQWLKDGFKLIEKQYPFLTETQELSEDYIFSIVDNKIVVVYGVREKAVNAAAEFNVEQFLHGMGTKFTAIERLLLAKLAPTFITTELQLKNFPAIKEIIGYLLSTNEITQEAVDKINELFLEQNIDLNQI